MASYTVQQGDTIDIIARRQYGDEIRADVIIEANPGLRELTPGTDLIIPREPFLVEPAPLVLDTASRNEVSVRIADERFRFWTEVEVTRRLDAVDEFALAASFDPNDQVFAEAFEPYLYTDVEVLVADQPIFTGTILDPTPEMDGDSLTISMGGYARAGVLEDVNPSEQSYPLQFDGWNLREVSNALVRPFGLNSVFSVDPGGAFDRVAIDPTTGIMTTLINLAKQRRIVVGSTRQGDLSFLRSIGIGDGEPVDELGPGSPVVAISPSFDHKDMFSHVTAIAPASFGFAGDRKTFRNPFLTGVLRPKVIEADDTYGGDAQIAAEAAMGRILAKAFSFEVELSSWYTSAGQLWEPNQLVRVFDPQVRIVRPYDFLIRQVKLKRVSSPTESKDTATLTLTLPGVYGGEYPERLPWQS